jgi:tetratricopeptide (TPR) repeat protein
MRKSLSLGFLVLVLGVGLAASSTPGELLSAGRVDEAVKVLKERTTSSSNDAEAWHLLCRSYYAKGRWDDAIDAAKRAVSLKPNSSDYHLWLGRAYGEKAESISAWHWLSALSLAGKTRTEFEKAVELDANNVGARSDLAEFYAEAPGIVGGGKDKARRQAQQLASKDAAAAHWINGKIAEQDKDMATAQDMQQAIERALASDKKRSEVFYDAASILYQSNLDLANAARLVRQYLTSANKVEEAPAFRAHYLLGNILEKQGEKQAAVAEYRAALDLNSDFADAQNALGRLTRP